MAIAQTTKIDFRNALQCELGIEIEQSEADRILSDLVRYFRLLNRLNKQLESPLQTQL